MIHFYSEMKFKSYNNRFKYLTRMGMLVVLTVLLTDCKGQSKVSNNAYSVMLKTLLHHSVDEIAVNELKEESLEKYILLDARENREFEVSHLKDAIHVGFDNFDMSSVIDLDKNDTILVYCSIGYRSEKIAEKLNEVGFESVYNLYGGLFEWVNRGGEVYNSENELTEDIHGFDRTWAIWLRKGNVVLDE